MFRAIYDNNKNFSPITMTQLFIFYELICISITIKLIHQHGLHSDFVLLPHFIIIEVWCSVPCPTMSSNI